MNSRSKQAGRVAASIAGATLLATSLSVGVVAQEEAEPIEVCELAYYTGSFASYGPSLTNDVRFVIDEVINTDPPLNRPWVLISEDIGDSMEGEAAKRCIEQHGAEIIVSIAHQYRNYRDYMLEQWAENDAPLAPTIHGGAIPGNLGGNVGEPLFRAQGVDDMLGVAGALYADSIGAEDVVIFATEVEGFQLAANAQEKAARGPRPQRVGPYRRPARAGVVSSRGPEDLRPGPGRRPHPGRVGGIRQHDQGSGGGRPGAQLDR